MPYEQGICHMKDFSYLVEQANWNDIFQLLEKGIYSYENFKSRSGLTLLGRAVVDDDLLMARRLLEMGAPAQSFTLLNQKTFSPLWEALERKNPEMVSLLLTYHVNPNEKHPQTDIYPFEYTSKEKDITMALNKELLEKGANPNGRTSQFIQKNWTCPLFFLISRVIEQEEFLNLIEYMLQNYPVLNLVDGYQSYSDAANLAFHLWKKTNIPYASTWTEKKQKDFWNRITKIESELERRLLKKKLRESSKEDEHKRI